VCVRYVFSPEANYMKELEEQQAKVVKRRTISVLLEGALWVGRVVHANAGISPCKDRDTGLSDGAAARPARAVLAPINPFPVGGIDLGVRESREGWADILRRLDVATSRQQ
jgi:hypothetical protein